MKKTGIELITEERKRQIEVEGYTSKHDAQHTCGELALAACCYAAPKQLFEQVNTKFYANKSIIFKDPWPFDIEYDKRRQFTKANYPIDPEEMTQDQRFSLLIKAGSFIAAEIDRLLALYNSNI